MYIFKMPKKLVLNTNFGIKVLWNWPMGSGCLTYPVLDDKTCSYTWDPSFRCWVFSAAAAPSIAAPSKTDSDSLGRTRLKPSTSAWVWTNSWDQFKKIWTCNFCKICLFFMSFFVFNYYPKNPSKTKTLFDTLMFLLSW